MRVHRFLAALLAGAVVLGGCSTEASSTENTYPRTTGISAESRAYAETLAYFVSEERAAPFRALLEKTGADWRSRMLSGEIPSSVVAEPSPGQQSVPQNGSARLQSVSQGSRTSIYVTVHMADGRVDTTKPVTALQIVTAEGRRIELSCSDINLPSDIHEPCSWNSGQALANSSKMAVDEGYYVVGHIKETIAVAPDGSHSVAVDYAVTDPNDSSRVVTIDAVK